VAVVLGFVLHRDRRGVGIMLGPVLAGAAVQLGSGILKSTHDYAAAWLVAAAAILASQLLLARVPPPRRSQQSRHQLRQGGV